MRLIAGSEKERRKKLNGNWDGGYTGQLDNCLPSTEKASKPQSLKTPRAKAAKASLSAQQPALPPAFPLFFPTLSLIPPFSIPSLPQMPAHLHPVVGVLIDLVLLQYIVEVAVDDDDDYP